MAMVQQLSHLLPPLHMGKRCLKLQMKSWQKFSSVLITIHILEINSLIVPNLSSILKPQLRRSQGLRSVLFPIHLKLWEITIPGSRQLP